MPLPDRKHKVRHGQSLAQNWRDALSRELEKTVRLVILGVGNEQKADDGAGCHCVRLIQKKIDRYLKDFKTAEPSAKQRIALRKVQISRKPGQEKIESKIGPFPFIQVLNAGETPENLTGIIRKFNPTHVLIIDAAIGGHKPGTISILNKKRISQNNLSTHRIPLSFLIRYLEESISCRVILLGIEPQEIALGKPVSPAVKSAAAALAENLFAILIERLPWDAFPLMR